MAPHFDLKEALILFEEFAGNVEHFMVDKEKDAPREGTLDMNSIAELAEAYAVFVSGGLTPENVATVVKIAKPFGVSVEQGIETKRKYDPDKVTEFITNART